ncbi:hypothetical protein PLICRDRAFT_176678 [Plicaturopsis crispa FD-325 SS-3]|nr:hypothetical protein PLICRDRAFT_176678 [Plicaturopsis crispa FD-325 SS-3]
MQSVPDIPSDMYRTARLVYRAYEEPDMDHIVSWMQDPQFASSLSRRAPNAIVCLPSEADPLAAGTPIGLVYLAGTDPALAHNRTTELSVFFGPRFHGQGYGTEAVRWALEMAFMRLGLHRVFLSTHGWHAAARRAYEKAGFTLEGTSRKAVFREGRFWDIIQMGILEEEWFALQGEDGSREKSEKKT